MKTWEELERIDDVVLPGVKKIIDDLNTDPEYQNHCPHLKRAGEYFYYCAGAVPKDTELKLEPSNLIYRTGVDLAQLQLHCMTRYAACCHNTGSLPFPGEKNS